MIDVLEHDIWNRWPWQDVLLMDSILARTIMELHVKDCAGDVYNKDGSIFVHRFGQSLHGKSEFADAFHVNNNHWVACDVDVICERLAYSDPAH